MKRIINYTIATFFYSGYIAQIPGTTASLLTVVIIYFFNIKGFWDLIILILLIGAGLATTGYVEKNDGKDPQHVVIDEVAGQWLTFLFIPLSFSILISGFILFRFFDIIKPLGIKSLQKFPGSIGIMVDDIAAGIISNLILQIILYFKLFG